MVEQMRLQIRKICCPDISIALSICSIYVCGLRQCGGCFWGRSLSLLLSRWNEAFLFRFTPFTLQMRCCRITTTLTTTTTTPPHAKDRLEFQTIPQPYFFVLGDFCDFIWRVFSCFSLVKNSIDKFVCFEE